MKYKIIYADPPWKYKWGEGKNGGNFAPEKHYETMSIEEICDLKVRDLRDKNCALFLWATMPALPEAMKVMEAWGFKYKTCAFTWVKIRKDGVPLMGPGSYSRANAEIVLLGMRGHIKSVSHSVPQIVMHERIGHSTKPPVVRDRIVQLFGDVSKIELFARQKTEGWDAIGYGIDGISVQEKIPIISSPDYKFESEYSEIEKIKSGEILSELRQVPENKLFNQGKNLTEQEIEKILFDFSTLTKKGLTKKDTIASLSNKYGRGYWALTNVVKNKITHMNYQTENLLFV